MKRGVLVTYIKPAQGYINSDLPRDTIPADALARDLASSPSGYTDCRVMSSRVLFEAFLFKLVDILVKEDGHREVAEARSKNMCDVEFAARTTSS